MNEQPLVGLPAGYTPSAGLLAGRVVLVTGASGAIGGAAARCVAALGATVVLLGKTVRKLEAVYDGIVEAGCAEPAIYPMNLEGAGPTDYDELAGRLGETFGRIDGLAWCAGMPGTPSPIEHQDPAEWLRVVHVNVHAPFLVARVLAPLLRSAPDASVVFLLCELARRARAYRGAYAVSQGALRGLAEVLADELEGEVRVSCLDPGRVRSPLRLASHPAERRAGLTAPEDVAPAIAYLLGPDGAAASGRTLRLD